MVFFDETFERVHLSYFSTSILLNLLHLEPHDFRQFKYRRINRNSYPLPDGR